MKKKPPKRLTTTDVADRHNVSRRTVNNWINIGLPNGVRLKASRLGTRLWRIDPADLFQFEEEAGL